MPVARRNAPAKSLSARQPDWRKESAGEVAVRMARRHLEAAADAVERLVDFSNPEALHDFRVALRRLRSVLRAYRSSLRQLPKKLRRDLKDMVRATGAGRDAEVFLDWLNSRSSYPAPERAAHDWLQQRLEQARDAAYRELRSEIPDAFTGVAKRLHRTLATTRNAAPYGDVTIVHLRDQAVLLAAELARVHSVADAEAIHAARILAKRLRYLIEPLSQRMPGANAVVQRLKTFQDDTGALCDGFVRRRLLTEAAEAAGAEQMRAALAGATGEGRETGSSTDIVSGLRALARRSEREIKKHYQRLQARCLGFHTRRWFEPFSRLERRLAVTRTR